MTTPENRVKVRVRKLLDSFGVYRHSPVQNGMGAPSLDFVCCYKGLYFAIETKAGTKRPTPRQEDTMSRIQQAGGRCFLVNEVEGLDLLELWLKETM